MAGDPVRRRGDGRPGAELSDIGQTYPKLLAIGGVNTGRLVAASFLLLLAFVISSITAGIVLRIASPSSVKTPDAWTLLATNLSLAAMIPAGMLLYAWVVRDSPRMSRGLLSSVRSGLRWRALAAFAGVALILELVGVGALALFVPQALDTGGAVRAPGVASSAAAILVVVVLTTPLQSAGEEYVFRGFLNQVLSRYIGWVVAAVVLGLLFMLAHGKLPWDSPSLFVNRFGFGLVACWLANRIGGLEGGIAIHVLNNLTVFTFAAFSGTLPTLLAPEDAPWAVTALDVAKYVLAALVIAAVADRLGLQRTREAAGAGPTG